jgi:hypothetical protein
VVLKQLTQLLYFFFDAHSSSRAAGSTRR